MLTEPFKHLDIQALSHSVIKSFIRHSNFVIDHFNLTSPSPHEPSRHHLQKA
jgi:hypothetical protein